jgi:putative FmdB family regulatory protein
MPIYEFYCEDCHRIFSFLSKRIDTATRPPCPKCARLLARRPSVFAVSKNRQEEPKAPAGGEPDLDDPRLERAMEALAAEAESIDESDPRAAARLMRRMFQATGMPVEGGMEEALRRMESGEDPEKIEEEMGDVFDKDPFGGDAPAAGGEPGEADKKGRLSRLRREMRPPSVDTHLYEM